MTDVRPATQDDRDLVARIAAESFYEDPLMSWILPDPARRLEQLVFVFSGLVDDMLQDHGLVHVVDGASTALWRDPEYDHGRTTADRLQEAAAATAFAEGPFEPDELERFGALGAAMTAAHPHDEHWYLNVVGTLPSRQSQGLGAAVLRPVLDRCDEEGIPAYLESSNPRNVSLYLRHGFVETGEITPAGGPSLTPMWRDPR
jgi:ribosomal protein S18 acetylase RimI-like enzyme